jgi:hypothetical protein
MKSFSRVDISSDSYGTARSVISKALIWKLDCGFLHWGVGEERETKGNNGRNEWALRRGFENYFEIDRTDLVD